jgi:hypothetical protein
MVSSCTAELQEASAVVIHSKNDPAGDLFL